MIFYRQVILDSESLTDSKSLRSRVSVQILTVTSKRPDVFTAQLTHCSGILDMLGLATQHRTGNSGSVQEEDMFCA